MINPDYYLRQLDLINPDRLTKPVLIIGAGNIGSWAALALGKMGCSNITLMDADTIELHNCSTQVYGSRDVGQSKVKAVRSYLARMIEHKPRIIPAAWTADTDLLPYRYIISAVDSITVRTDLFNALVAAGHTGVFIDGRMGGNILSIYTVNLNQTADIENYRRTLFSASNALRLPCSAQGTIYNCFIMAGYIADALAQTVNGRPVPSEIEIDLFNFTNYTTYPAGPGGYSDRGSPPVAFPALPVT